MTPTATELIKEMDSQEMRPVLVSFSKYMEAILKENDHRGGWCGNSLEDLFSRLEHQCDALGAALPTGQAHRVRKECADIANFAMMIYDKVTAASDEIVGVDI